MAKQKTVKIRTINEHEFGGQRITSFGTIKFNKQGVATVEEKAALALMRASRSLVPADGSTSPHEKAAPTEELQVQQLALMKMKALGNIPSMQNLLILGGLPIAKFANLDTLDKLAQFGVNNLDKKVMVKFLELDGAKLKKWLDRAFMDPDARAELEEQEQEVEDAKMTDAEVQERVRQEEEPEQEEEPVISPTEEESEESPEPPADEEAEGEETPEETPE